MLLLVLILLLGKTIGLLLLLLLVVLLFKLGLLRLAALETVVGTEGERDVEVVVIMVF